MSKPQTMIEDEIVSACKFVAPQSRGFHIVRYYRNSGRVAQEDCRVCGDRGPTWCNDYPKTLRAITWAKTHTEMHLAQTRGVIMHQITANHKNHLTFPIAIVSGMLMRRKDGWERLDGQAPTLGQIRRARVVAGVQERGGAK